MGGRYPVDTVASFSCNHEYKISGSVKTTCQPSGSWNLNPPSCNQSNESDICISNANYFPLGVYILTVLSHKDNTVNYKYFVAVTCPAISLSHGLVSYNRDQIGEDLYPLGTVASFSCDKGYHRDGCEATTCPASGEWNLHPPTCNQGI